MEIPIFYYLIYCIGEQFRYHKNAENTARYWHKWTHVSSQHDTELNLTKRSDAGHSVGKLFEL